MTKKGILIDLILCPTDDLKVMNELLFPSVGRMAHLYIRMRTPLRGIFKAMV